MDTNELKKNLLNGETWLRGLFLVLFAIVYSVARVLVGLVALFQFLVCLFAGEANARTLRFGQQLSTYLYQVLLFLTFNSDLRPWPFSAWPAGEPAVAKKPAGAEAPARKKRTAKKASSKKTAAKKPPDDTGAGGSEDDKS